METELYFCYCDLEIFLLKYGMKNIIVHFMCLIRSNKDKILLFSMINFKQANAEIDFFSN